MDDIRKHERARARLGGLGGSNDADSSRSSDDQLEDDIASQTPHPTFLLASLDASSLHRAQAILQKTFNHGIRL